MQRFIARDPIGFRGGDTNLHAYVSTMTELNPLTLKGYYGQSFE